MNPKVNSIGLWVIIMCQCKFIFGKNMHHSGKERCQFRYWESYSREPVHVQRHLLESMLHSHMCNLGMHAPLGNPCQWRQGQWINTPHLRCILYGFLEDPGSFQPSCPQWWPPLRHILIAGYAISVPVSFSLAPYYYLFLRISALLSRGAPG